MAEEKKLSNIKDNVAENSKKLTYEQLEAYAQQTTEQAKRIYQENQMLKQALTEANISNSFKEIECVLKCLDHVELFSPKFIASVIERLEEILSPDRKGDTESTESTEKEA